MATYNVNCLICGEELKYTPEYTSEKCLLCGKTFDTNVKCIKGHYICDACHSLPSAELISRFCTNSELKNPIEQAILLMRDKSIAMHGPEHHFLVPAVLLSAFYNVMGEKVTKEKQIKIAQKRAANVLGGFCGFYGDCGAAVGVGIFVSLLLGATPLSKKEWRLSNLATGRALITIAENGGPRCCKRNSFLAILEAVEFVKEQLGVMIPINTAIQCIFTDMNKQCRKNECRFYPIK